MREEWVEVELGDVCFTTSGGTPSRKVSGYYKGDIPWVKSGELKYNVIHDAEERISSEAIRNSSAKVFPKGTLLIALYGATIGKLSVLGIPAASNQAVCGIYENEIVTTKFLYHYLFHKKQKLIEQSAGGAQPNISQAILKRLSVCLAPLPEQRAIVDKIELLFSELENGIANLKTAKVKLEIYRQAVLKKAFEGELTKEWREKNKYSLYAFLSGIKKQKEIAISAKLIPKANYFPTFEDKDLTYYTPSTWINLPLKTITSNNKYAMKRGPFGSALRKECFVSNGVVVYEQGHAINDDPYKHRYFITDNKYAELKAFTVKGGDIIISCSGVTLGRICLLPENADLGIINQALLKIDLDETIILKKYFIMLFRSETFQRLLFKKSVGTAMPNMVGLAELREIPIPIPSLQEQAQIVQEIETRLTLCDNILTDIDEGLIKAEALRQSILKKAFEGRLLNEAELEACRREPDWEPAEQLLERIKKSKKEDAKK